MSASQALWLTRLEGAAHLLHEGRWLMAQAALISGVRRHVLVLGLLLLLTTQAIAGSLVRNIRLYDGGNAPIVEIPYTGNTGE